MPSRSPHLRKLHALWRDTVLLLREFGAPLAVFSGAIVGLGLLYWWLAGLHGIAMQPTQAVYLVLSLTFLQSFGDWPAAYPLQAFWFLMPLVGFALLAQGLADFSTLLFNRRTRGREWAMAVASTYHDHVILVGLGRLGLRVVRHLHELGQEVVVIELAPRPEMLDEIRALEVPVIPGDARVEATLAAAGAARARSVVICTQDDALNLQVALKARHLKAGIDVVIRIFDDDFAQHLTRQSGFRAFSATAMAAPLFAAAAANVDITPPVVVDGEAMSLARFTLAAGHPLVARSVDAVEQAYDLSIVLISHGQERDFHPPGERVLKAGDHVAVLGAPPQLQRVVNGR